MDNKKKITTIGISLLLGTSLLLPIIGHAEGNETSELKGKNVIEERYEQKAIDILTYKSESSPLTILNKEQIVDYYAEIYMPVEGCSLLDLPNDSSMDYEPPKPKKKAVKKAVEKKQEVKEEKAPKKKESLQTLAKKTEKVAKPAVIEGKKVSMSADERMWLEKMVEAEATGESYEGKVAVASVIANRVTSSQFPNSVMGVIKQNNGKFHQFSPWDDGRIYKMNPTESSKKAVVEVFDKGVRNVPNDTLYFAVKTIAFDNWMGKTRKHNLTIGNHAFFSGEAK